MRIISQNGTYNFPLENVYLGLDANDMTKINVYSAESGLFLKTAAVYSRINRAKEILATLTTNKAGIFQFPEDEDLQ